MRISDWSSDVCSSDLVGGAVRGRCVERKRGPRCTPAAVAVAAGPRPDDLAVGAASRHPDDDLLHPHHHRDDGRQRSEEHTSELQSLMRISYAVFCLKKKKKQNNKSICN